MIFTSNIINYIAIFLFCISSQTLRSAGLYSLKLKHPGKLDILLNSTPDKKILIKTSIHSEGLAFSRKEIEALFEKEFNIAKAIEAKNEYETLCNSNSTMDKKIGEECLSNHSSMFGNAIEVGNTIQKILSLTQKEIPYTVMYSWASQELNAFEQSQGLPL